MAATRYYIRMIEDDETTALITHFEVSGECLDDLRDLVEAWQDKNPKPGPLGCQCLSPLGNLMARVSSLVV